MFEPSACGPDLFLDQRDMTVGNKGFKLVSRLDARLSAQCDWQGHLPFGADSRHMVSFTYNVPVKVVDFFT